MASAGRCIVNGCGEPVHAKGYCRKHYGQIWRKGAVSQIPDERDEDRASRSDAERLRALERELRKAEHMYQVVVGYEGRIKWRREMEAVKSEISKLEKPADS